MDVEITGAANVAIDLSDAARLALLAQPHSRQPRRGAGDPRRGFTANQPNVFARNGLSERVGAALIVERDTQPAFFGNVFQGLPTEVFRALGRRRRRVWLTTTGSWT